MVDITSAEWNVLNCLWEKKKCTGKQVCELLQQRVGWSRSTTLTMLRRMQKKGLIEVDESGKMQMFSTKVQQQEATLQETRNFIDRVYHGSLGLMLTTLTEKKELSSEEIAELRAILERAGSDDV